MDTLSQERNRNNAILAGAVAGVVTSILVGIVTLALWGAMFARGDSPSKQLDALSDRLAAMESKVAEAAASADKANMNIAKLQSAVQSAFDAIGPEIGRMKTSIRRLEDASTPAQETAPEPRSADAGRDVRPKAGPSD